MAKLIKAEAERSKSSVRHARQKAMDAVKLSFKAEDERARAEKEVGLSQVLHLFLNRSRFLLINVRISQNLMMG